MKNPVRPGIVLVACLTFFLLLGVSWLQAATLYVSPGGNNSPPYGDWTTAATKAQTAINASSNGDVIVVDSGTYFENLNLGSRSISLVSRYFLTTNESYIANTILDGSNAAQVVTVGTNGVVGAVLSGFTIQNGRTTNNGAGIQCWHSNLRVDHSVIRNGQAGRQGGGIYLELSTCVVQNVRIENNSATNYNAGSGGIRASYSKLSLENSWVVSNQAICGGGMQLYHSDVTIKSSVIAYNRALLNGGGGVYLDGSSPTLINCTLYGNAAQGGDVGGAVNASFSSKPTLRNCVLWSNSPQQVAFSTNWSGMNVTIQYCDVQGGSNGVVTFGKGPVYWRSSFDLDPQFAPGGYSPPSSSPCINAGTNESWMSSALDLSGATRLVGAAVDVGAYEYQGGSGGVTVSTPSVPAGATTNYVGATASYTTGGSTCSDGSAVQYRFDWGDGSFSDWGVSNSSQAWAGAGVYSVKAQARSVSNYTAVSSWSGSKTVVIVALPPLVHYASPTGGNVSPYTNWAMAALKIQDAVNIAANGAMIIVDSGTYYENINLSGRSLSVVSRYHLTSNDSYIAGTILDGSNAAQVVSIFTNPIAGTYISGFTIQNGRTTNNGAGIQCWNGNLRVENCVIRNGQAGHQGGGIYLEWSTCAVKNVRIENNASTNYNAGSGGLRASYSKLTMDNSFVVSNQAICGGGFQFYHSDVTIRNTLIAYNRALLNGGGGVYLDGSSPTLINCTLYGNAAQGGDVGGGLNASYYSRPVLRNCIFWGNTPQQVAFSTNWSGMNVTIQYCDLQGGSNAVVTFNKGPVYWRNSFDLDPQFGAGGFGLPAMSPCVNTGTNELWLFYSTDLAGANRIVGDTVDQGAYEFQGGAEEVTVNPPDEPSGDATNYVGVNLLFSTGGSTASDGSPVEYRFDWGDGTVSEWGDPSQYHAWAAAGVFYLTAQARSVSNYASASSWSTETRLDIIVCPPLVHYVAPGGGNIPPYTNWAMAARKIQDAIDIAADGASVVVSNGLYFEALNFKGKDINVFSLFDWTGDGNRIAETIIDGSNVDSVIVMTNGESSAARVSGFTIQHGYAHGASAYEQAGGGIRCVYASPTLENLVIQENTVVGQGGGLYFACGYSEIRNVVLRNNNGPGCGGGGGIRASYGAIKLFNVSIVSNISQAGAGLFLYHGTPTLRNVLIADNIATGDGGGAMYFDACSPDMVNVTITGNRATGEGEGGALNVSYYSQPRLINCIIWSNWPQQVFFNRDWFGMAITLDHTVLDGGTSAIVTLGKGPVYWLGGSISADPLFVDDNNYRLQAGSPCVDTGTNQSWMATCNDLDGNPRVFNSVVDMGAYEWAPSAAPVGNVLCAIYPADVCSAGARWRLMAGSDTNWHVGGETVRDLSPGDYTVTFLPVSGWLTPEDQEVAVLTNVTTSISAIYQAVIQDVIPPVIFSIFPWNEYVTTSNKLWMTIVVTDNVGVASVTVNGDSTEMVASNTYRYLAKPLTGQFHYQTVVAVDLFGNRSTQVVYYTHTPHYLLTALWNGYWELQNPYDEDFPFTWKVKNDPETGTGFCPAHSNAFFNTTLGQKNVQIIDTNGDVVAEKGWSPKDPPAEDTAPAFLDSDMDGLLNIEEEIAGSDMGDATSSFSIGQNLASEGAGPLKRLVNGSEPVSVFTWSSSSNSLYTLEVSSNLCDWTALPGMTDVQGTGQEMTYTNSVQDDTFFLRIWAKRP